MKLGKLNGTVIGAAALTLVTACGRSGSPPDDSTADFDRNALLRSYTDRIVLPALRDFATVADALVDATEALQTATAAGSASEPETTAARDAWRAAMMSWETIEVLQVGPAGSPSMTMGGRGLRDEIYSWPAVNPCRVDQETATQDFKSADFFTRELVNTRGLAAVEYLLFDADNNNACASQVDINSNGTWANLQTSGQIPVLRAAYAARAAADVSRRAAELRDAWEPSRGNFADQLSNAGMSGSIYDTAQEAVDAVFAALFYVELQVKDRKLAIPAGLNPECFSTVCPELQESPWADFSKEELLANLRTVEQVFLGADSAAVSFDDFLRALGAGDLADQMAANIRFAIDTNAAIPGTISDALANDPSSVRSAHAAVKTFTDDLKSQFVTVLNLTVPREGAGDND